MAKRGKSTTGRGEDDVIPDEGPATSKVAFDPSAMGEKVVDTTLLHKRFGDVMNEIVLDGLYRITQIVIGAVPAGGVTHDGDVATIHVFGKVVGSNAPSTARFECLYERLQQPETGSSTVQLNGVITKHLVFRGQYQTVPLCVYGWKLDDLAAGYDGKQGEHSSVDTAVEVFDEDDCVFGTAEFVGKDLLFGDGVDACDSADGGDGPDRGKPLGLSDVVDMCRDDRLSSHESLTLLKNELEPLVNRVYENKFTSGVSPSEGDVEGDAVSPLKRQLLANKAISWISALFGALHGGSVPSPALVSLASVGLDLLVVALQDPRVAKGFAVHGGCVILRCILGMRGLPGSFYNKAVALACEVVRQAGEAGMSGLVETDAKESRLGDEKGFFEVSENLDDGKSREETKKVGRGRKRKSSPSADEDGEGRAREPADLEDADKRHEEGNELGRELNDIASGAYAASVRDLWDSQLRSRVTLAEAISGHGGRFKPMAGTTHISVISKAVDFYRALKDVLRELRKLKECLGGMMEGVESEEAASGADRSAYDPSKTMASTDEALQELVGIVSRTQVCDLSADGNGFRHSGDMWDTVLLQIFAKLFSECELLESINGVVECVEQHADEIRSGGTVNPGRNVLGALSAMVVEFLSAMLDQPMCLAFSSFQLLKQTISSSVLASDANPHVVAYKGYTARVTSMLDSSRTLIRLASADWDSLDTLKLSSSKPCLTYDNMMFRGVGDKLLEKCRLALTQYITHAKISTVGQEDDAETSSLPSIKDMEVSLSVALGILQRLLVTSDPRLLEWWIPASGRFYELVAALVGHRAFMTSEEAAPIEQKVMGGLFVCSRVHATGQSDANGENAEPMGSRGGLVEVIDIMSAHLPWVSVKDNTDGVMDASEYFDLLDAVFFGNTVSVSMSWDDVRLLVDDAEILGQLVTSVNVLRSYLEYSSDGPGIVQRLGGNDLLLRALVCATEVLSASRADDLWMHRVGTSMDFCSMTNNQTLATELFESVTRCMYFYLKGVARIARVESLPLLQTLIKAHAAAAIHTQAMMDAGLKTSFVNSNTLCMRNARWNVTRALRFWISCPGLRPRVIPTALVGAVAAPSKSGCTVSFSPTAILCLSLLLGDIFPSEWPKTTSVNTLAPEDKRYRASLTEELESCIVPLEYMISCCASSDLSYIRSATVRFMCKGAGLGGGMGTFLIGIIATQLDEALLPMTFAQVGMYDARKVLELLVPLLYQPALKAAALDTNIPQTIANMVETIIKQSITFGAAFDRVESSSLVTMALECLTTLADPSISLDVFQLDRPGDASDVLRQEAGAAICCTILDHIAIIGENVPIALKLLETMAGNRRGRECILHGVVKLCTKNQAEQVENPSGEQIMTAAQWMVHQYQNIQLQADEQAPDEIVKETTKFVFGTLASVLKRACVGGLHYDIDLPSMDSRKAPIKFAVQAKEATSRGSRRFIAEFPCNGGHIQLLQDCQELAVFWKNQALRPIAPVSAVTNAAKLSKYVNWDIGSETMDKFCIAGILHPWLTHPRRPLNESMRAKPDFDPDHPTPEQMDVNQGAPPNAVIPEQDLQPPGDLPLGEQPDDRTGATDGKQSTDDPHGADRNIKDAARDDAMDSQRETDKTAAVDTQVNVDLGALSDLFRQQPPQTQAAEAAEVEDIDEDIDLYADLLPAPIAPSTEDAEAAPGEQNENES